MPACRDDDTDGNQDERDRVIPVRLFPQDGDGDGRDEQRRQIVEDTHARRAQYGDTGINEIDRADGGKNGGKDNGAHRRQGRDHRPAGPGGA